MPLFGGRRKDDQGDEAERLRRAAEAEHSGMLCLKDGRLEAAAVEFRRCVDLNPRHAVGHGYLGLALYRLGRLDEAEQEIRTALDLAPEDEVLHRTRGMVLEALNRPDEAAHAYKRAIALNPQSARAHAALGSLAARRGDLHAAEAHVSTALSIDDRDTQALSELADIRAGLGNRESAIALLRKALVFRPQSAALHFKLGVLLDESGQTSLAIEALRQAHDGLAHDPDVVYALGRALMKGADEAGVQSLYEKAMKATPEQRERYEADLYKLLVEIPGIAEPSGAPAAKQAPPARPAETPRAQAAGGTAGAELLLAIARLEAAVEREPGNSRLLRDLSIQYMRAGKLSEAKAVARQAEQVHGARG